MDKTNAAWLARPKYDSLFPLSAKNPPPSPMTRQEFSDVAKADGLARIPPLNEWFNLNGNKYRMRRTGEAVWVPQTHGGTIPDEGGWAFPREVELIVEQK